MAHHLAAAARHSAAGGACVGAQEELLKHAIARAGPDPHAARKANGALASSSGGGGGEAAEAERSAILVQLQSVLRDLDGSKKQQIKAGVRRAMGGVGGEVIGEAVGPMSPLCM